MPRPTHLITNLAYRLKPHHTRNLYLRASLDTCADVNLIPASVYQLVFNDAKMQKLAPRKLQIGTYTTDTVKIVGSCIFCLVHSDTKKLIEVTFYVAMNDGSVLLSCNTTLLLGLIQPRPRLDYLLPRASPFHQHSRSPQENKSSITYNKTRSVCSKYKASSGHSNTSCQETGTQADNKQGDDPPMCTQMSLNGLASSQGQITISRWILAYHPSKHLADQAVPTRDKQDASGRWTCPMD